jgi:hypothetical protein
MASPPTGLVIKRDSETIDAAAINTPLPVDPGPHTLIAEAPGYKRFETQVTITRGGRRFVTIPALDRIPAPPPPPPVAVTPPPPPPSRPPVPEATVVSARPGFAESNDPPHTRYITIRDTWSGTRQAAVAVGVVGAASIGAGIYFGVRANDLASQSDRLCPGEVCIDTDGLRLNDDAKTNATRANIFLIGGGAALAAATVLGFVGAPHERTVFAPSVSSDSVGATFAGRF